MRKNYQLSHAIRATSSVVFRLKKIEAHMDKAGSTLMHAILDLQEGDSVAAENKLCNLLADLWYERQNVTKSKAKAARELAKIRQSRRKYK